VASDVNKPNGQHFIGPSEKEIRNFVHPLPCRKISGIGRVMEKTLRGVLGIETVKDLYNKRAEVFYLFKPATAQFLMRACIGYSDDFKQSDATEKDAEDSLHCKGISHERTFSATSSWTELCTKLESITNCLIEDLKMRSLKPKTISLKVKLTNFDILSKTASREIALFQPGNMKQSSQDLLDTVIKLLKEAKTTYTSNHNDSFAVRLLGVRCSNFQVTKDNQVSLDRYRMMSPDTKGIKQSSEMSPVPARSPVVSNPYKTSPKNNSCNILSTTSLLEDYSNANEPTSKIFIQCPICGSSLNSDQDNSTINAHIDACLNSSTVKRLAKEETVFAELKNGEKIKKKKRSLTDFFNS
jgi:DNA polymerase kappa